MTLRGMHHRSEACRRAAGPGRVVVDGEMRARPLDGRRGDAARGAGRWKTGGRPGKVPGKESARTARRPGAAALAPPAETDGVRGTVCARARVRLGVGTVDCGWCARVRTL
jgi:hypothetical protein